VLPNPTLDPTITLDLPDGSAPIAYAPPPALMIEAIVGQAPAAPTGHELIVVDDTLPDHQRLIGLIEAAAGDRDTQVLVLDSSRNGIEQIAEALATGGP